MAPPRPRPPAATRPEVPQPAARTPAARARPPAAKAASLAKFTHATFAGRIGERFEATDEHGARHVLVLERCEAVPLEWGGVRRGRRPFSLQFAGPRPAPLAQGTYRIQHARLGWFDLFIVPRGQDAAGTHYEAVFG